MANVWTGNPVIDTAEDRNGTFLIDRFEYWPAAINNDLEIQDNAGAVIWKMRADGACANGEDGAKAVLSFPYPKKIKGLYIKTIDGGALHIYKSEGSPS
jgi:hypothetical protein